MVANVDLAPTFADAAGVRRRFADLTKVDGRSILDVLAGDADAVRGDVLLEQAERETRATVPAYCGMRTSRALYVRYATGEEEFYRLDVDPYQLDNVAPLEPRAVRRLREATKRACRPRPPGFR